MSAVIEAIKAREILDSRGRPTIEVEMSAAGGALERASVPSGASTGAAEALELRDRDPARYDGLGVRTAVRNVNEIVAPKVHGHPLDDQAGLDRLLLQMDGTPNKSNLGANALLAVSLAAARLSAAAQRIPLYRRFWQLWQRALADRKVDSPLLAGPGPRMPIPMTNMISGGMHAGGNIEFQDFLVIPHAAPDYTTGLEWIVRIYRRLSAVLREGGFEGYLVGDEGGFGPRLRDNAHAAECVVRAIEAAGLQPGGQVSLAVDVASSRFYEGERYAFKVDGQPRRHTSHEMIAELQKLAGKFPIVSIEDGLAEEDWPGWQELHRRLGDKVRLVGDDLFTTNPARIQRGIQLRAANSVLVKMNQVGTITETMDAMAVAVSGGMERVVSARSGETEDDSLADLAVGVAGQYIKIGGIVRSERLAKYNRLLRIEEELGSGKP